MPDPAPEPAAAAPSDPNQSPAWQSYLMPGTDVLRTVAELTNPVAVALFERMVSADAETTLRRNTERPRSLDLAHLSNIHEQLFADVYPFAGQLRYVDMGKPGQTGEPFLHHRWIETYTAAVTEQLRAQDNLAGQQRPGTVGRPRRLLLGRRAARAPVPGGQRPLGADLGRGPGRGGWARPGLDPQLS